MSRVLIFLSLFLLSGCSTVTKGTHQTVSIMTPGAHGAECHLTSRAIGNQVMTAPGNIAVPKSRKDIQVVCRKECFEDGVGTIQSTVAAMTAGNLLLGGGVGLVVDAASGAMNKYQPNLTIPMKPIPGCRPKR